MLTKKDNEKWKYEQTIPGFGHNIQQAVKLSATDYFIVGGYKGNGRILTCHKLDSLDAIKQNLDKIINEDEDS